MVVQLTRVGTKPLLITLTTIIYKMNLCMQPHQSHQKMDETVRKKHVREPPSIPFLWELKPGIPKKDWKPEASSSSVCNHPLPKISPLKLIASVPFVWEEKPGIPLPNFSQVSVDSVNPKPDTVLIHVASSSGYSIASSYDYDYKNKQSSSESKSITSLDLEAFSFEAAEPSCSVPSLLANCLVSSAKISNAIPLHEKSSSEHDCDQLETPSSPASSETDSDTSSYATGRSSPTGSAILECLFPLHTPTKSSFLERDGNATKMLSSSALEQKGKDFGNEDWTCDMVRRAPTLGELIMMSRRRSYVRKANQIGKWDQPKKIRRQQAFGCFSMVTNSSVIEGLLKKKYPKLKLI